MIVIPDIHGRSFWRDAVDEYAGKEHIVFLGDYMDPYQDEGISVEDAFYVLQELVGIKKENPDDITLLLGNHDLHYLHKGMAGSRYDYDNADFFRSYFEDNRDYFRIAHEAVIGGKKYLFSHAGILPGWMKEHEFIFYSVKPYNIVSRLDRVWQTPELWHFLFDALSDISYLRGGRSRYGSMVWADVSEHDSKHEEIPGYYQVFGHTLMYRPIINDYFACLDCQKIFRINEDGIRQVII